MNSQASFEIYGPYHALYAANETLWKGHVGKMVETYYQTIAQDKVGSMSALDLGAGEGDNGIYLAVRGFDVCMVELSPAAHANYQRRLTSLEPAITQRLNYTCARVQDYPLEDSFDLVIAYGLLHCFRSSEDARAIAQRCIDATKPGGNIIVSCITSEIVPGDEHQDLQNCYLPTRDDLENWFYDLNLIAHEFEIIDERHGKGKHHQHEIFRAIYWK